MTLQQLLRLRLNIFQTSKDKWIYISFTSIFFLIFLGFYQPFGLWAIFHDPSNSLFDLVMFFTAECFTCASVLVLSKFYLVPALKLKNTAKIIFQYFLFEIFLIVLFSHIGLSLILPEKEIQVKTFYDFFFYYLSHVFVLLYPLLGFIVYHFLKQLYENNKNLEKSNQSLEQDKVELEKEIKIANTRFKVLTKGDEIIEILDENNKCKITTSLNSLYTIESQNQYVIIQYTKNNTLVELSVRTRFSKLLGELESHPNLFRCHRSYAVNLNNVSHLDYIDHKPYLILEKENSIKIPVSKTYLKATKEQLTRF